MRILVFLIFTTYANSKRYSYVESGNPEGKGVIFDINDNNSMYYIERNLKKNCNLVPTNLDMKDCGWYMSSSTGCRHTDGIFVLYKASLSMCPSKSSIAQCASDTLASHICETFFWEELPVIIFIFSCGLLFVSYFVYLCIRKCIERNIELGEDTPLV